MKTALLIIDMQEFFLPMTKVALPNILTLGNFFNQKGWPIILTQHGHPDSDFKPPIRNQLVRRWGSSGSIRINTPEWELIGAIAELRSKSDPVIQKNTYDAFQCTDLENFLKEKGVERLVLTGVMTDCCVETTARRAFCMGFETWVVSDGTGSANAAQHKAGLRTLEWAFGDIVTTNDAIRKLGEGAE